MKKIITAVISLVLAVTALTGYNNYYKRNTSEKHSIRHSSASIVADVNNNSIVLVKVSQDLTNNTCMVTPITTDGKCHPVEVASDSFSLKEICTSNLTAGEQIYTENDMNEILSLCNRITTNNCDTYNGENTDYVVSLYAVKCDANGIPEFELLGTNGAAVSIPDDSNAYQLCNYFGIEWA